MNLLILLLLLAVALVTVIVIVQAAIIRELRAIQRVYEQRSQAQEQRYHLMWDVRRLNEAEIFRLQLVTNALTEWIQRAGGERGGGRRIEGDEWKDGGGSATGQ